MQRMPVTGRMDRKTWRRLVEATYELGERLLYLRTPHFRGKDVEQLQLAMKTLGFNCGRVDAILGIATERAVREFQKNTGVDTDGIVGPSTIRSLENLRKIIWDGRAPAFPRTRPKRPSPANIFQGKHIVVVGMKPQLGDSFRPQVVNERPRQLVGKDGKTTRDLCLRLGNLLDLLGAQISYVSSRQSMEKSSGPPWPKGTSATSRPDLAVAIRLGCSDNPSESGVRTLYSAVRGFKTKSRQAAKYLHQEATSLLKVGDRGMGEETWVVDFSVEAPSILLEPVCASNPREAKLLEDEGFRQRIAVAAFDGLKLHFEEELKKTGTLKASVSKKVGRTIGNERL